MNAIPNIEALKKMSNMLIDGQFLQKIGVPLFNYSGEVTPEVLENCTMFRNSCDSIVAEIEALKSMLPKA